MAQRYFAVVSDIRKLTPSIIEVSLVKKDGSKFPPFLPGQYMTIAFPSHTSIKGERPFSIASSPANTVTLTFGIRMLGKYTRGMEIIRKGDSAYVSGPFGEFIFEPTRDQHAVFIAGGIGVTPFLSMLQGATDLHMPNHLLLVYSVRSREEAAYADLLDKLQKQNPKLRVVYAFANETHASRTPHIIPGRITREELANACDNIILGKTFFVCGPPAFMKSMKRHLASLGVPSNTIFSEKFGVASSAFYETGSSMPKIVIAGWALTALGIGALLVHNEQEKREHINASLQTVPKNVPIVQPTNAQPANANTPPTIVTPTPVNTSPTNTNAAKTTPLKNVNAAKPINTNTTPAPKKVAPTPAPQQTAPVQPRTRMS